MASIAHVIHPKAVEFHRLHSHRQIVFWRFSTKNFSDFGTNDLLFFLSSTNRKEKGLLGFGQLKESKNLKTKNVFSYYGKQLGENSNEEFIEMITRLKKTEEFPDKLNCLLLENVTYFKSPIYLSDFGYDLSKQVESFIYFDSDQNITSQILFKASKSGLDLWSETQDPFNHQLQALATCYQAARIIKESELFRDRNNHRFKITQGDPLMMTSMVKYILKDNKLTLILPVYTQMKKEHYSVLGLIKILENKINQSAVIKVEFNNPPNFNSPLLDYSNERIYLGEAL